MPNSKGFMLKNESRGLSIAKYLDFGKVIKFYLFSKNLLSEERHLVAEEKIFFNYFTRVKLLDKEHLTCGCISLRLNLIKVHAML